MRNLKFKTITVLLVTFLFASSDIFASGNNKNISLRKPKVAVKQEAAPQKKDPKPVAVSGPQRVTGPVQVNSPVKVIQKQTYVTRTKLSPPSRRIEVIPSRPSLRAIWIPGYWVFDISLGYYVWISGYWDIDPFGTRWIPGYWSYINGYYYWTDGYWID